MKCETCTCVAQRCDGGCAVVVGSVQSLTACVRACLLQATALKLHDTKGQLEQVLQQARERLEAGLPPTDDADMEWSALVRQQQTLEDLRAQREQVRACSRCRRPTWVCVSCLWWSHGRVCVTNCAEPACLPA
jgi:hypothetical protein